MPNRCLVLAYHAANVNGVDYATNDHVALAADLQTISDAGWRLATLEEVVRRGLDEPEGDERLIALSCDDGISLDYHDFDHPAHGQQPSLRRIVAEYAQANLDQTVELTCFVIASAEARAQLDEKDFMSLGLWPDAWWEPATRDGLLRIENHSWDHNHPSVDPTAQKDQHKGRFEPIDSFAECEAEIAQSQDYIAQRSGRRPQYFAYPWGQASDYLRTEYLPNNAKRLGLQAAFGCDPGLINARSDRWMLPRSVCGQQWSSSEELAALLRGYA